MNLLERIFFVVAVKFFWGFMFMDLSEEVEKGGFRRLRKKLFEIKMGCFSRFFAVFLYFILYLVGLGFFLEKGNFVF